MQALHGPQNYAQSPKFRPIHMSLKESPSNFVEPKCNFPIVPNGLFVHFDQLETDTWLVRSRLRWAQIQHNNNLDTNIRVVRG